MALPHSSRLADTAQLPTGDVMIPTRLVFAICLTALLPSLFCAHANAEDQANWRKARRERLQDRMSEMAKHLGITASQQPAWQKYVAAKDAVFAQRPRQRQADSDAVAESKQRAADAQEMATKLSKLATATSSLASVLNADQNKLFNEMARHRPHLHDSWRDRNDLSGRGFDGQGGDNTGPPLGNPDQ